MADRIQQRRDTAARWVQYNPILLEGEVGYVTDDPNQYKIGDGVHAWNELPLRGFDGTLVHTTGDSTSSVMSQKATSDEIDKARAMSLYNRIVLYGSSVINFTRGGFMNSTGKIETASDSYGYSELIFLPKNGTYVITHHATNNSHAVVFDENLDVVEAHNSGADFKTTITTEGDNRYLVISNNFSMVSSPDFEHSNSIYDTAIEDLKYLSERYLQYSAYYNSNAANEEWTENGYYGANGSVITSEDYSYCKAPLNGNKYVFIDHCNIPNLGLIGIVFFNEDTVMLAQVVTASGTSFTMTAPNGATHYGYNKLKTNTKAMSYTAPFAGAIGGKIFASLLKNFDADELISKMRFSKISDPEYSEIMKAKSVNSVLSEYSTQFADYSALSGFMGGNNVVGGTLKATQSENWRIQIINSNNNNILVTGIDIAPDGHILYAELDENDNIINIVNEFELTHIDKKVIYGTKAAKIAINRRVSTIFDAQLVNFSFVRTIDLPMLSDNILSLFPSKEVEPHINWITGEFYSSTKGNIASSMPVWRRCKEPIPSNATKISINHINVAATGKIVVLFWGDDADTVLDAITAESNSEDYSAEIPISFGAKYWGINSRTTNNNVKVTFNVVQSLSEVDTNKGLSEITVENSDKIAIIGDSYTESHYTVKGKAYINKMSLFSDYVFMNFAQSGDVYNGRLYAIRQNTPIYGTVPFARYRPKFTMMCCYTNDIKVMDTRQFLDCLQNIINVTRGLGTEPIVCTEYHTGNTNDSKMGVRTGLAGVAERNGLMFWDIASYVDLIRGDNYAPFWGGSHPGSRTNAIQSDNYEKYLKGLERPAKSLKLFRPRNSDTSDLDNLMFNTNFERAKLFKEIFVGHSALNNSALVDNCTDAANSKVMSEYQKLMEKSAVSFNNACLVSAVLPFIADTVNYLALNLKSYVGEGMKVYVRNSMASPYPANTRYTRFDYTSITTKPSVGDIYTASNDGNVKQFTVVGVVEGIGDGDALGAIFCSPADTSANDSGTLTRISGTGDASIPYSYRAVGYLQGDLGKDTCGHWVELLEDDEEGGLYPIPASLIDSSIYTDRVDFLLVCSGDFSVSDLSVVHNVGISKGYHRQIIPFETNYINDNEELFPSNTFGEVGENDTNWNVYPTDIYEHINGTNTYPVECSSKVDVTDSQVLEYTVPNEKLKNGIRKAIAEIWCRYFPPVYTDGSGEQITEDSFDYNEIKLDVGVGSKYISTLSEKVNTHWKIVRFPITLIKTSASDSIKLKIYSDSKGIEVAYLSLKYVD